MIPEGRLYDVHLHFAPKVAGVDYGFYRELLAGKYDDQVNKGLSSEEQRRGYAGV